MDAASAESKQMLLTAWEVGGPACGLSFTVGALIITYTILGVPIILLVECPPNPILFAKAPVVRVWGRVLFQNIGFRV